MGSSFWVDDSDSLSEDGSVHSLGGVVIGSSFRVDDSVVLSVDEEVVHGGLVVVSVAQDDGLLLVKQMHSFPANKNSKLSESIGEMRHFF